VTLVGVAESFQGGPTTVCFPHHEVIDLGEITSLFEVGIVEKLLTAEGGHRRYPCPLEYLHRLVVGMVYCPF